MIWLAYMDTEHFQFHASGRTEDHARDQLAAGFARHLENRSEIMENPDRPFEFWNPDNTPPTADRLHDYYGIRTIDLQSAEAFCDGEKI